MAGWRQVSSLGLILAVSGVGCAHFLETQTIERFSENLQKSDLDGLKSTTSEEFASRALRTAQAIDDLKILKIPDGKGDGKISVVKVEHVSGSHKRVTVQVGEAKKEVFYELTRTASGRWVVDDIYLKQKKQGVEAYKAVSEQMDLLLTVREFVDACDVGERGEILTGTTPALKSALEKLPPNYLARLTQQIIKGRDAKGHKPQATISENTAVVKLPRKTGELLLVLELLDDHWLVDDVHIESKDEAQKLPSLYREAVAVEHCLNFLAAYERGDRAALEKLSTDSFYKGSLSVGNLREVRLPSSLLIDHDLKASLNGLRADFTLRNDREMVQLTLHRDAGEDLDSEPHYRVSSVSVYDLSNQQEMRLSALFTAKAMGEFYLEALAERDVSKLKHSSTRDFSSRVWQKFNDATIATAPLEPFDGPPAKVGQIQFDGALVRLPVLAGEYPIELMLREESGRFLIDDIHWEIPGRPMTAKQTLELVLPVRNFAHGIALGRDVKQQKAAIDRLQETSSRDFNRMVWTQTASVPQEGFSADKYLNAPLKSLTQSEGQVIVQLGDQQFGAVVTMVKEQDRYAIDEVMLINGPQPHDRLAMKRELRSYLASTPVNQIQQAAFSAPAEKPRSRIVSADFQEEQPAPKQPAAAPRELPDPEDAAPIELWTEDDAIQTEPGME